MNLHQRVLVQGVVQDTVQRDSFADENFRESLKLDFAIKISWIVGNDNNARAGNGERY